MYQTIQLSSCVSVQGEFVEVAANGDVVIRDGGTIYRGRPVARAVPLSNLDLQLLVAAPGPTAWCRDGA